MRYSKRFLWFVAGLASATMLVCGASTAVSRTWTDATGKFTIEAEMIDAGDGSVTLKKADGTTKQVPLNKLSAADQKFVADRLAAMSEDSKNETGEGKTGEPKAAEGTAADRTAARKVVTEFFDFLRKDDRAPIAATLTAAAIENITSGNSPVLTLPKPEPRSVRVGKATIDGDEATVTAKFRFEGTNQEAKVYLRREEDAWKIRALSASTTGGEEQMIEFETGGSSAESPSEFAGEPGRSEELSEGEMKSPTASDPKGLLQNIETLGKDPRMVQDQEFRKASLVSIADAAAKVLSHADATKAQRTTAAKYQLEVIQALIGSDVPDLNERATAFAAQVEEQGLEEFVRPAQALLLRMELQASTNPAAVAAAMQKIQQFLTSGRIGPSEAMLASAVASVAENWQRRGMDGAMISAGLQQLAEPLVASGDNQVAAMGRQIEATARRLGLVGNPMELQGVTWDGKPLDMSQFEGKVVLVDFWATWCGPCIAEMPNIRANYDKYHERGFDVIAISIDSKLEALNQYVEKEQVPWTVVADRHSKTPESKQLAAYYGVNSIPCTILIGRDGKVITLNARGKALDKQLEKLLASGG